MRIAAAVMMATMATMAAGCEGPAGAAGDAGATGATGEQGERGAAGPEGERGPAGDDAATAAALSCDWCAAGAVACSPDGGAVQVCSAAEGEACGEWEVLEQCDGRCADLPRVDGVDALGNRPRSTPTCVAAGECALDAECPLGWVCDVGACRAPFQRSTSCLDGLVCDSGEACSAAGTCEDSETWLTARAYLQTSFDGKLHEFSASGERLRATCTTDVVGYWDATEYGCDLEVEATAWTQSNQGAAFAGEVFGPVLLRVRVDSAGEREVGCDVAPWLRANRFELGAPVCTLNVTALDASSGGHVEATFSAVVPAAGPGEEVGDSELTVGMSFRVAVP